MWDLEMTLWTHESVKRLFWESLFSGSKVPIVEETKHLSTSTSNATGTWIYIWLKNTDTHRTPPLPSRCTFWTRHGTNMAIQGRESKPCVWHPNEFPQAFNMPHIQMTLAAWVGGSHKERQIRLLSKKTKRITASKQSLNQKKIHIWMS